ncbi:flavin reductase family protein [Qipengyuania gaetbuli]|nr:flavin reductase family protein [Qipengyuania gaetbuli]
MAVAPLAMFDPQAFRSALGSFVTGVTIVTTRDADGRPVGLTANSFNSVSLDPPMVLWSLSLHSGSLPVFREAQSWAVHVLAADQQAMSDRFAQPGNDKFAGLDVVDGPEGAPMLAGYAARFGCRARFEYEGGDHAIFLGEVVEFERRDAEPLIYHSGRYGRLMRAPTGEDLEHEGLAEKSGEGLALTERGLELLRALEGIAKR